MPDYASAAEALQALVASTDSQTLAGTDGAVLFNLMGEGGGQWTVTIADGQLSLAEGVVGSPVVRLRLETDDFVALVNRRLNPISAFMQGRVRVEGDMGVAMRLQALFV